MVVEDDYVALNSIFALHAVPVAGAAHVLELRVTSVVVDRSLNAEALVNYEDFLVNIFPHVDRVDSERVGGW